MTEEAREARKWVIGGLDAAAFAALLTIVQMDGNPNPCIHAAVLLSIAVPVLSLRLVLNQIFDQHGAIETVIETLGVLSAMTGIAWMLTRISFTCAIIFIGVSLGALAVPIILDRVRRPK